MEQLSEIFYQTSSYNWTEADMVFMTPYELPLRLDWRYNDTEHDDLKDLFRGNYFFDVNIESYNRLYHTNAETKKKYLTKRDKKVDENGEYVYHLDTRFNDTENAYVHEFSYVEPGNEDDTFGGIQFVN